jgi:hypothetical protein
MKIEAEGSRAGDVSAALQDVVFAALVAGRQNEARRDYLGGSRLGEECLRRLAYEWHGIDPDPGAGFGGRMLRVFDRGHDSEARMARHLRAAGFQLQTLNAKGQGQLGFSFLKDPETGRGRIGGNVDGVIHGGPDIGLAFPALWESKCLKDSSWKDLVRHRLQKSKPIYYTQVNIYMASLKLDRCLFTAENADTCEIYAEVIPVDMRTAQAALDRGVQVVMGRAPEDAPPMSRDREHFKCKTCEFRARCQASATSTPPGGASVQAPAWA